jgi:hypothetical protein
VSTGASKSVLISFDGAELARAAIEDYIDQRDTLWHELTYSAQISAEEIEHLHARNEFVEQILKTKVVSGLFLPERIGLEELRIKVCTAFITRVRIEIAANNRTLNAFMTASVWSGRPMLCDLL